MWLGSFVAPLAAPILYGMLFYTFSDFTIDPQTYDEHSLEALLVALVVFYIPLSYITSFIVGMPLIYILKRFEKLSFWWVALSSIPLGIFIFTVFFALLLVLGATIKGNMWTELARFAGFGAIYGFIVAATFCLLAGITVPGRLSQGKS
jgi:hypothetical protein